jgi:hypothetical protein
MDQPYYQISVLLILTLARLLLPLACVLLCGWLGGRLRQIKGMC